jgi:protein-tyrosine phosphatase
MGRMNLKGGSRVIDMHCHILANMDDGPDWLEESIHMLHAAAAEGIDTIVATPHHLKGDFNNSSKTILKATNALNDLVLAEGLPITILPGQETRINGEMVMQLKSGEILLINQTSPYVFVELPSKDVPNYTSQLLFDIQVKTGIQPIIVHPERNEIFLEKPNLLYSLVKGGALTQITAGSIVGQFGRKIQRFSRKLIEHNLVHFVASGAKNAVDFHMQEAYEWIDKKFGKEKRGYFQKNAKQVIKGESVLPDEPRRFRTKTPLSQLLN